MIKNSAILIKTKLPNTELNKTKKTTDFKIADQIQNRTALWEITLHGMFS